MSCIAHNCRTSWICRMGLLGGLIQQCDRIGCLVFFFLERGTSDIRVLRLGLGGVVVAIWRFDRSGSLSCQEHRARSRDTGAHTEKGTRRACPHLSWEIVWSVPPLFGQVATGQPVLK